MRIFGLLVGLGLTLSPTAFVGIGEWAELRYEEKCGWLLELPGGQCDCLSYAIAGSPPREGWPRSYDGYTVADYDEGVGTITLSHAKKEDLVIRFARLSEWLDVLEEYDVKWSPGPVNVMATSCTATVPGHTCSCSADGPGHKCESGTKKNGMNWARCFDASGTTYCEGKSGSCSCEAL